MVGATHRWLVLGFIRKEQSGREEANKPHPSMASASVPASRFSTGVPAVASLHTGLWLGCISQRNPDLPKFLSVMVFDQSSRLQSETLVWGG